MCDCRPGRNRVTNASASEHDAPRRCIRRLRGQRRPRTVRALLRAMARALRLRSPKERGDRIQLAAKRDRARPPTAAPAKTRPAWVNAPPQLVGDVYQMSIAVGPYTTRAECDAKLPEALQEALDHYVNVCLGDQAVDDIRLPADYLREQLVKAQWEETRQHSVGPMTWLHVQLQFDRKIKDRILEEHRQAIIGRRLHAVATWSAIGVGALDGGFRLSEDRPGDRRRLSRPLAVGGRSGHTGIGGCGGGCRVVGIGI